MSTPFASQDDMPGNNHSRRMIFVYTVIVTIVLALCLTWGVIFAIKHAWLMALSEFVATAVAAASLLLIRAGRLNTFIILAQSAFLVFVTTFCLMFDVPNAEYPRVTHLFLLMLATLGYINHLRRPSRVQLALIVLCLAAFVFFASSNIALPFAEPIPNGIRQGGIWINAMLAMTLLCGALYGLQRTFARSGSLVRSMLNGLRTNQFTLFYQPQVNRDGMVIGAEALLRWQHPKQGMIPPDTFITVAEEAGLMPLLGGWVLKEAAQTLADWQKDPALSRLTLAVNVSASQFSEDRFVSNVRDIITSHGIDPTKLKLEITESVMIAGMATVTGKMNELRAIGISFALDDFGTGYSSLSYLRQIPVSHIKIDRSFVRETFESDKGATLLGSIIKMGLDLGMTVVAEGVETEDQLAFLQERQCHEFQGYYFGRPQERKAFEAHVHQSAQTFSTIETAEPPSRPLRVVSRS